MKSDLRRWPDADALLDAALALPKRDRAEYVQRTVSDAELAKALMEVLAEDKADDFLAPAGAWTGVIGDELRDVVEETSPALAPGSSIDRYQVIAAIGRGGMGEVYRARDTQLGRDVALKVLPQRYVANQDRQARFDREARVLAALNHPGIATIYGVAESQGIHALVLELVEGPTLAEVLQSGAMTVDRAIPIARRIADALAAAHERGILHRDLKPANIKIAPPSIVKLLDFGLARVLFADQIDAPPHDTSEMSPHVVLGTAAYMSPEAARGRRVDARADIWAFGCVLFEMLTGSKAFSGDTVTEVLAAVIEREPSFDRLPAATPPSLRRLLRRCLQKDPERRLGYIGDARLDLDDSAAEPPATHDDRPYGRRWASVAVVGALALLVGVALAAAYQRLRSVPPPAVARVSMALSAGDQPVTGFQPSVAISPDGRTVVYRARRGNVTQLFRRDLDRLEPVPIPGTESSTGPFFSPDGRSLGFDADGVLKRVPLSGGVPVVICSAPGGATSAWLDDDTIVFATNTTRVLQRVPASGGTPETLTALDTARGDTLHLLPEALPGANAVLFTIVAGEHRHVAALTLASRRITLMTEGSGARYLSGGFIVFARAGALWGTAFDPSRLALTRQAVPFDERAAHTDNVVFQYAVASDGSLAYLPQRAATERQRLLWLDRSGRETPVDVEPRPYERMSLSPDGTRLALAVADEGNTDIWIADPGRNTMSRLTFETTIETMPTWSPDGRWVAFRSEREGPGLFKRDAQGAGTAERLSATDGPIHSPYSWTPDGESLLLAVFRSFRQQAIGRVTPPDLKVEVLLDGDFAQLDPQVAPGGRWMAYQSDETGRFEIYVRPYPDVKSNRWLISTRGGTSPRWASNGRELFYYDGEALIRVPVETGAAFSAGAPARVAAIRPFGGRLGPDIEIAPDGQRFLFLVPAPVLQAPTPSIVLVQNLVEELRARLASTR